MILFIHVLNYINLAFGLIANSSVVIRETTKKVNLLVVGPIRGGGVNIEQLKNYLFCGFTQCMF